MGNNPSSPSFISSLFRLLKDGAPSPSYDESSFEFQGSEEFRSCYDSHIKKHLRDFEDNRIEALAKLRQRFIIGIPILIAISVLIAYVFSILFTFGNVASNFSFFFLVFGGIFMFFWISSPSDSHKALIGSVIFSEIFKFFGDSFSYSPTSSIDKEVLSFSRIIPKFNYEKSKNNIRGEYKGIKFDFLSSTLMMNHQKGSHVVFCGILVTLSLNKNFSHFTMIRVSEWSLSDSINEKFPDLKRVEFKDVSFENNFEIYSSNQTEARSLLTTDFIERLLSLSKRSDGELKASFFSNQLLLMIPGITFVKDDFLDSSIFMPTNLSKDVELIFNTVKEIFSVIDTLRL